MRLEQMNFDVNRGLFAIFSYLLLVSYFGGSKNLGKRFDFTLGNLYGCLALNISIPPFPHWQIDLRDSCYTTRQLSLVKRKGIVAER